MTIKPGDLVWYLGEKGVYSAHVLSIMTVENAHEDWACTKEQKEAFTPFGPAGTYVATVHYILPINKVFKSKEELLASL